MATGASGGHQSAMNKNNTKAFALDRLSAREREVLKLVVDGWTSKAIARALGLMPATIDTYRSRIMTKLQIHDLASLVRFAIRHGLTKL
jgi:DNA-binding NarL/FixJ family response regulator